MSDHVYKICGRAEWQAAQRAGRYAGNADDARDGFIHLSAAHQLEGTRRKHFAGQSDLVLLRVDAAALGEALRWELSRGGEAFPHLYGELRLDAVIEVAPLDEAG